MKVAFRGAILQVHRWSGLTVGLLLVFLAVTGLGLLFRPQLEPLVERHLLEARRCDARASLDAVVAAARGARPGQPIEEIEIAARPGASIIVRSADRQEIYVDPCTAAVIGAKPHWGGFFGAVEQLHRFRFLDAWTGDVIGGMAASMMVLVFVAGGITIWWPASRRALKSAFRLKPALKGRAFDLNLHRTTGIYVSVVLLVVGLSAIPLAFKPVRNAIFSLAGAPLPLPKPKGRAAAGAMAPVPLEQIWRKAQSMVPGASIATIALPRESLDPVEIFMLASDAPHANARTYAWFDAATGEVLRFEPYAASSLGNKAYRFLSSLHMGYIGGVFGQILLFLGIVGVPVLGYTGIASYLRGRLRRQ